MDIPTLQQHNEQVHIDPDDPQRVVVITRTLELWVSDDSGETFSMVYSGAEGKELEPARVTVHQVAEMKKLDSYVPKEGE